MKKSYLRTHGKAAFEVIEEGFVLLRSAPAGVWATYYVGAIPFVAGFLVLCSDLAGAHDAAGRLAGSTFVMAVLFLWMKAFQAAFCRQLHDRLHGADAPRPSSGDRLRRVVTQVIIQSTGLFLIPLSILAVLPLGWAYAFYQNASILDDGRLRLREVVRASWQQCLLWPAQNHIVFSLLAFFCLYVLIDWLTIVMIAPQLVRMFFGIESVFTQSPISMLNTTVLATVMALAYLSVDPLAKACYVVRCFYGRSLRSGDDLRTELRRLNRTTPVLVAVFLAFLAAPLPAAPPSSPPPAVERAELDRAIDNVVRQEKYLWRNPGERPDQKKESFVSVLLARLKKSLKAATEAVAEFLKKLLERFFPRDRSSLSAAGFAGMSYLTWIFVGLALLAATGLGYAAVRALRGRTKLGHAVATSVPVTPDLHDEQTAADQMPEDEWTRLGRELLAQGKLRLALRAFYLANLAHLAERGLITIVRSKSNRDYERELLRRGHTLPDLCARFRENVGTFERIWYGRHDIDAGLVGHFVANLEKMKLPA